MSALGAAHRGRLLAESLMVDTCTIVRVAGETTNPTTCVSTPTTVLVYSGRCRLKAPETAIDPRESGGHVSVITPGELHVPVGSYAPHPGDVATITSAVADDQIVGLKFRVESPFQGSLTTAYRLRITQEAS